MATFTYGWGENGTVTDPFWMKFAASSRAPKTWKEEVFAAAKAIADSTDKPLWLCMSGGIDSEIMAHAFFEQDIPFSALTLEHQAGTNAHDISYAKKWCAQRGVTHRIVPIDMQAFMGRDIFAYAEQGYITDSVFRYLQIKLLETVESFGGYGVLGGGEQYYLVRSDDPARVPYLSFDVGYVASLEWCKKNKASHQPYFYFNTPELMLAYMRLPFVECALRQKDVFLNTLNVYLLKRIAYYTEWPDFESRYKFNGFENVSDERKHAQAKLRSHFGSLIQYYALPIPELEKQLLSRDPGTA